MRGVEADDADAKVLRHERELGQQRQPSCDKDDPDSEAVRRSHAQKCRVGAAAQLLSRLTAFSTATISMRKGKRYESFPSMSTIKYYYEAFEISVYSFVLEVFLQADSSLSST